MRERTHGEGFATRAIHAGERPDPVTHAHTRRSTRPRRSRSTPRPRRRTRSTGRWPGSPARTSIRGPATRRIGRSRRRSPRSRVPRTASSRRRGWRRSRRRCSRTSGPGDHVVVGDELFAITNVLLEEDLPRRGIDVTPVDTTDLGGDRGGDHAGDAGDVRRDARPTRGCACRTSTRSPRSPIATGSLFIADNTFLGPALLRPLEHGADLVLHAATKYLSGHGDAVSGVVVRVARR